MIMLESYDRNNTNNLAPFADPQTQKDGLANNGNGGPITPARFLTASRLEFHKEPPSPPT